MLLFWKKILSIIVPDFINKVFSWVNAHRRESLIIGLVFIIGWMQVKLIYWRSQAQALAVYETLLLDQNKKVEAWKAAALEARAGAKLVRLEVAKLYNKEKELTAKILAQAKTPITCEDSWLRVFNDIEGIKWR